MEIPPVSSFAQASAYFTGFSEQEQSENVLAIHPHSFPNKFLESSDRKVGFSVSSVDTDFRTNDFQEAYRMWIGQTMYPFQSIADITNHQYDPSYFDGSEETENFNVSENLLGAPLADSALVDPRVAYIENLLKLKEYTAGNLPLDDSYLKALYLSDAEKGANYYFHQLQDMDEALGNYARSRNMENMTGLRETYFTKQINQGVLDHTVENSERPLKLSSETPQVQSNFRRDRMRKIDQTFETPYETNDYQRSDLKDVNQNMRSMPRQSRIEDKPSPLEQGVKVVKDVVVKSTLKAVGDTAGKFVQSITNEPTGVLNFATSQFIQTVGNSYYKSSTEKKDDEIKPILDDPLPNSYPDWYDNGRTVGTSKAPSRIPSTSSVKPTKQKGVYSTKNPDLVIDKTGSIPLTRNRRPDEYRKRRR